MSEVKKIIGIPEGETQFDTSQEIVQKLDSCFFVDEKTRLTSQNTTELETDGWQL